MKPYCGVLAGTIALALCAVQALAQTPEQQEAELQAVHDRCMEVSGTSPTTQAIQACTRSVVFFQSNPLPGPTSARRNLTALNNSLSVRGKLYFAAGDYARAIDDFSGAIGHPLSEYDRKNYFIDRGFSYLAQGQDPRAIQDFIQSLAVVADSDTGLAAFALYGRGLAQRHKSDRALGDRDIAMAQQLFPQVDEAVAAQFPYKEH